MMKSCMLAFLAVSLIAATTVVAQENSGTQPSAPMAGPHGRGPGHMDPEMRADMMAKHLNLTADQRSKVLEILKSAQSQAESLRSDTSVPQQERRSKMMEIHKSADDQIRAILDSNQQQKWDEMQSRRQQHRQGGQAPSSPNSSPQQ
jgi:periplasmic protein CpxP/Spy